MKLNSLLYFLFGISVTFPVNAYEVPTTKQNKNVLLEEYTGIHCGYCPQGHAIANSMLMAQPTSVYVIAVHAGMFATPGPDEPDFRTTVGNTINSTIGSESYGAGYPSGSVNRHAFSGTSTITGRTEWTKNGKYINEGSAPINLWMKSEFDGNTRKLTVKVEGYYTENVDKEFNLLNVALIQNNIKGPQSGGQLGSDYIHKHMLRAYITPLWGDTVKSPRQGEYFSREYTYTMPADINKVELKAEDIELVAFVCEDKTEVLNVIGGKPSYLNYEKPINAVLLSPDQSINTNYGYNFFEARLKNESDKAITSAQFEVKINENVQQATWNGTIHAFESLPIRIPVETYAFVSSNAYEISLKKINDLAVERSTIKGSFGAPAECTANLLIELQTDLYADENIFAIKDQNGNVVKEFGPYETAKKAVYKDEITLERDKVYCFDIVDAWGDGIQSPRGYFKLLNKEDNSMITQQMDLKLYGHRFFFKTSWASGIAESKYTNSAFWSESGNIKVRFTAVDSGIAEILLYAVSGEQVSHIVLPVGANEVYTEEISSLPKGLYLVKMQQAGKSETMKVSVK